MNLETVVLGASEQLDFLLPLPPDNHPNPATHILRDLLIMADRRLKLRILVTVGTLNSTNPDYIVGHGGLSLRAINFYSVDELEDAALKFESYYGSIGLVIADGREAAIIETAADKHEPPIQLTRKLQEVDAIQAHFDYLWTSSRSTDGLGLILFDNLLRPSFADVGSQIAHVSEHQWSSLIAELNRNPTDILRLSSREFEQLIARLLQGRGYSVQLTPGTRDGGKDILIATPTELGDLIYFVECKRYDPNKPVGVSLVRALYGVIERERATAGLLVTTSRFTQDALAFREPIKHRLALHDFDKIREWIQDHLLRH